MAKDVSSKLVSGSDDSENTTPSSIDQQKVPPLRIVLNTSAANHKGSSAKSSNSTTDQQQNQPQQQPPQQPKGPLRYSAKKSNFLIANNHKSGTKTNKLSASETAAQSSKEEDSATSHLSSHLRRITRRSQRSIQTVGNEEEESMSSVTSADENPNANNGDTNIPGQEQVHSSKRTDESNEHASATVTTSSTTAATTTTTSSTTSTTVTNPSASSNSNSDTPRRYKRRKCDLKESTAYDTETIFNSQNYKPPLQNSFELYKSIRLQVDKKLESLHSIQPRTPHGFRDYMLNRGAYLLDGNKLGNGTNLYMNEDGGLNSRPMSKYHALKQSRANYSVPNRAKVPLGLPVNSPLYNLFIEQEKERYRMRIQHIKEREKLTLATEQEIIRVYNQAARTAADQNEPFSACTMLKHQEVYNYLDSDGQILQSSDDLQQELEKPSGGRSRRRHNQTQQNQQESSTSTSQRNNKETEQDQKSSEPPSKAGSKSPESNAESKSKDDSAEKGQDDPKRPEEHDKKVKSDSRSGATKMDIDSQSASQPVIANEESVSKIDDDESKSASKDKQPKKSNEGEKAQAKDHSTLGEADDNAMDVSDEASSNAKAIKEESKEVSSQKEPDTCDRNETKDLETSSEKADVKEKVKSSSVTKEDDKSTAQSKDTQANVATNESNIATSDADSKGENHPTQETGDDDNDSRASQNNGKSAEPNISDDDKKAQIRETFLLQLQEIDDKWDKIRNEMLVRHRNEAESLHAVQKLEWEWKTKEIGACDVRTTPIIDILHVPKLNIYSQDY